MENLKSNIYTTALDLLKQGEQLLQTAKVPEDISENEKAKLLALTYNNIGCFYKKKNQANVALKYLKSALELETSSQQDAMNIAGTMLNICAILSMLKKNNNEELNDEQQQEIYTKNIYTTRSIALYNLGVEHEYLNEYEKSLECFNQSVQIIQTFLDAEEQMMKLVSDGIVGIQNKMKQKMNFSSSQIIIPGTNSSSIGESKQQMPPNNDYSAHKRGQSSRGSSVPQFSELNQTYSSRGSYGFDQIKNKPSLISSNQNDEKAPQNPYMNTGSQPLNEIKEELNYLKKQMYQRKFQSQMSNYDQNQLPPTYQKVNVLSALEPSSKVVQNYKKAASVLKMKDKDNTSRFNMSEIEEEKSIMSAYPRRDKSGKRQPTNKSQLNKTVRLNEDVNLPKLSRFSKNSQQASDQESNNNPTTNNSFFDQNSEILASSSAIKYNNIKQLPPRAPSIQSKKKILLTEINDKMRINTTQDNIRENSNTRNTPSQHSPYKTQMAFVSQAIENPQKNLLNKIMSQFNNSSSSNKMSIGSERSKTSNETKYQSSIKRIENRLNDLQSKFIQNQYKDLTDVIEEDHNTFGRNSVNKVYREMESRSAYQDKISQKISKNSRF